MSSSKEPSYFSKNWGDGIGFYEQNFAHYTGQKAVGEATVGYMPNPVVPARIHQILPDVKFIFALRHPIERAFSHYWWRFHNGHETRSFDEVLSDGIREYPIAFGLYYTQITRFLQYFSLQQMYFIITEDMTRNFMGVLKNIFVFLDVDPKINILNVQPRNTAQMYRIMNVQRFIKWYSRASILRNFVSDKFNPTLIRLSQKIIKLNKKPFKPPTLNNEQIDLLYGYFQSEIEGLENLLGLDLANWKV